MIQVGQQFTRLTVLSEGEPYFLKNGKKRRRYTTQCTCGAVKLMHAENLASGKSKSCGCLGRENSSLACATHGMSGTKIYAVWSAMWYRCTNPSYHHYADYGGRGITVCDEWKSFECFFKDMGDIPEGCTLDRKKNNLGYSAINCTWSTPTEQGNNRRSTVILTHNGVTKPLTLWAAEIGISRHTLANRIRLGWSTARALTTTLRPY